MQAVKDTQPKALYMLFFCELWERFGFYAIQALMVLYLTNALLFTDKHAYNVAGGFSALLYATPLIGGYLADRILGFQRAILFGFILYILGYLLLDNNSHLVFYFSLALLVIANGFFKANISSLLGTLYSREDLRRDRGFTLFYMGINIGSMAGPTFAAIVQIHFGYHAAFAMCGIGLLTGLIVFLATRKKLLKHHGLEPLDFIEGKEKLFFRKRQYIYFFSFIAVFFVAWIIPKPDLTNVFLGFIFIIVVFYAVFQVIKLQKMVEKKRLIALLILILYSVIFWAFYLQLLFSLTLFAERNMNRDLFGWVVPVAALATFSGIFLILLSPLFIKLWQRLDSLKKNPSTGLKFSLSMLFMTLSFVVIIFADDTSKMGVITIYWFLLAGFIREIGEILISPIGLSAVTRLAPEKLTGTMMGVWFMALAAAGAIAGRMSDIAAIPKSVTGAVNTMHIYNHAFIDFAWIAGGITVISLLVTPWFNKLTGEKLFN